MPQPGKSLLKKNILSDQTMNKTLMDQSYDTFLTKTSNEQTNSFETFSSIEEELCNIEQNSPDDNIRGDKSFNKNSFGINLTTSPINEENIISHIQESIFFLNYKYLILGHLVCHPRFHLLVAELHSTNTLVRVLRQKTQSQYIIFIFLIFYF